MKKCKKLLTALTAAAAMSVLFAGSAMAMYELYDVEWDDGDDYSAVATWDDDDCDYGSYQVKLIRNGNDDDPVKEITTSAQHHNFTEDITREGSYTFRVRVRFGSDDEGEWYESDEYDVDDDWIYHVHGHHYDDDGYTGASGSVTPGPSGSAGPGAVSSGTGWIQNGSTWYYRNPDGSLAANGWDPINGHWYYFNSSGVMETGWIDDTSDGHWYYCATANDTARYGVPEGAMLTNTTTPDGYHVGSTGAWD